MPLREDILKPIPGENPGGPDLRYAPVYDKIKEARREDDQLAQGAWQIERKVADHAAVIKLAQETIATGSKDLQLAAWLTESLLKTKGFAGLNDGLALCRGLIEGFWDTLHPELEEGDAELRAGPLDFIGSKLDVPVRHVGLNREGHDFFEYKASRAIIYEDQAKTKEQKSARDAALKEGKLAPEIFDRAFGETPKAFYAEAEKSLDTCLESLTGIDKLCTEKFGDAAPAFGKLHTALEEVRHVVHGFLQKKREFEPDPVEEAPPPPAEAAAAEGEAPPAATPGAVPTLDLNLTVRASAEPADRAAAIAGVASAAQFLRKREPLSPAPYLMLRGLRWGELRASSDPAVLEAPPTEVRRQIKALALNNKWLELLETAENVMALPCGRAWLDLQRFVVEACGALGSDYDAIAIAIRSQLRALVRDLPQLLEATLSDETPAANPETQTWLRELLAEPADAAPLPKMPRVPVIDNSHDRQWQKKYVDPHALATEAMRRGQPQKAFEILYSEVERQRSGRGRFQRKLQLAQISIGAGKDTIAQPLLDDIAAAIETHKLEEWEDREMVASVLAFLLQNSKKIQADAKLKQAMFERICRLDPVQAFQV
ncbi:MAG TPA: type VI secretion system protein TssA [Bryobacteraceae bacterium]|nr:type VI secretion system protein TssA [Bryobacteraceae bacterium]